MNVLLSEWRGDGSLVFVSLGDVLVVGDSRDACARATHAVIATLKRAGFTLNARKSEIEPRQVIEY